MYTTSSTAQFEPPVIIDPPNPVVGDVIRVGLFTTFFPPCLILPQENQQGDTHLFEPENNHIDLTVVFRNIPICNPFPVSPAPREFYELGQLEEGTYTIQPFIVSEFIPLPVPPYITPAIYGSEINFSVTTHLAIDSISNFGLIPLIILFLILALFFTKNTGQPLFSDLP